MKKILLLLLTVCIANFSFGQAGIINRIAGTPPTGFGSGYSGDYGQATAAQIDNPTGVAIDINGNIYIADQSNHVIRKIDIYGIITTIAGIAGSSGFSGDLGDARAAQLDWPRGVAVDRYGNVYIADFNNNRIRKINSAGIISTIAGLDTHGSTGDGGLAIYAKLYNPNGVAVDNIGNIYIADFYNNKIRKINTSGIITTFAGTGSGGFSGDFGPATAAQLSYPSAVAVDNSGNVYIADDFNNRIRKVNTAGTISTIAGGGTGTFGGDYGDARVATLNYPTGVAVDNLGNIYIADSYNNRIRKVNTAGIITTIAGGASSGSSGDGSAASSALLNYPYGVAVDSLSNIYIADNGNSVIRKINSGIVYISPITGISNVCLGSTITVSDITAGGTWSSSNSSIVSIGGTTGILTGVSAGIATITYTIGISNVTKSITVNPLPASISGPSYMCNTTTTISNLLPIESWESGLPDTWSISSGGVGTPWLQVSGTSTTYPNTGGTPPGGGTYVAEYNSYLVPNGGYSTLVSPSFSLVGITGGTLSLWMFRDTTSVYANDSLEGILIGQNTSTTLSTATLIGFVPRSNTIPTLSTTGVSTPTAAGWYQYTFNITGSAPTNYIFIQGYSQYGNNVYMDLVKVTGSTSSSSPSITLTDATIGGIWSSNNTSVATIGTTTGVATSVSAGTATISYTNACGSAVYPITVYGNPASITGASSLCASTTITLSDSTLGGTWSSSNTSIATILSSGVVTGVSAGVVTISYNIINSCGSLFATKTLTVNASIATITGVNSLCAGSNTTLADGTTGGTWLSSNTSMVTVNSSGVIFGINGGNATISYTVGSCFATKNITINPLPAVPSHITGYVGVIRTGHVTLADSIAGGSWGSSDPYIASVSSSGVVTGNTLGTTYIHYGISNSCGTKSDSVSMTVLPFVYPITGPTAVCAGSTITLYDGIPGGSWASYTTNVSVNAIDGQHCIVTGLSYGNATIVYYGDTNNVTYNIMVNIPFDSATNFAITGTSNVCIGNSITLHDSTFGGVWSSVSAGLATVSSSGVVTGLASGIAIISYADSNSCGSAVTSKTITINPLASAGTITGLANVCVGANDTFSVSGVVGTGVWGITNSTLATMSYTGILQGLSPGLDTVFYGVYNVCGIDTGRFTVHVNPMPNAGIITGIASVCSGDTMSVHNIISGGLWSISNTNATLAAGIVTGVVPGKDTITYTFTNICGTAIATKYITINPLPNAGILTGPTGVCKDATITFTDASTGGVMTLRNANASISGNVVTGITPGNDTVIYTVTNICGIDSATQPIIINPLPYAGIITADALLCQGSTLTCTDAVVGGTWSVKNTKASISAGGVLTGITPGTDTVRYRVTTPTCGSDTAFYTVVINPLPHAGSITGLDSVCPGATITLSDTSSSGIWSCTNTQSSITTFGVVTGNITGSTIIMYKVTNICGTDSTTKVIIIKSLASSIISGPHNACVTLSDTLIGTPVGGTWHASNAAVTISSAGVVLGEGEGNVTISYSVTNTCNTAVDTYNVQVNAMPTALVTGNTRVCIGTPITLTGIPVGGIWHSNNASATVSGSGVVTGYTSGKDTILYTFTNICGSAGYPFEEDIYTKQQCDSLNEVKTIPNDRQFKVYPNPTTGMFTIELPEINQNITITLLDLLGNEVTTKEIKNNNERKIQFNISYLAKGTYLLKVATENKIYRERIVVW